ncbi:MAG: V-type ATP synthase subunit E family protein [Candidatus Woesearchaeota archaeon]
MTLENVKQEIIDQAEQEAKSIIEEAEKEAKQMDDKATLEIEEFKTDARKRNESLLEAMERKMLAQARFDAQRLQMNSKKEMIEEVINNTRAKLSTLNKTEKQKFLKKLLIKAKGEIDVAKVFANKNDLSLISGVKTESYNISGGLIAQNQDGTISTNLSVEELLESASNEMLVEISGVLFGKN